MLREPPPSICPDQTVSTCTGGSVDQRALFLGTVLFPELFLSSLTLCQSVPGQGSADPSPLGAIFLTGESEKGSGRTETHLIFARLVLEADSAGQRVHEPRQRRLFSLYEPAHVTRIVQSFRMDTPTAAERR